MTIRTIELTTGQSITDSIPFPQKRVAGLHAGTTWIADNFDDPLPDLFWGLISI